MRVLIFIACFWASLVQAEQRTFIVEWGLIDLARVGFELHETPSEYIMATSFELTGLASMYQRKSYSTTFGDINMIPASPLQHRRITEISKGQRSTLVRWSSGSPVSETDPPANADPVTPVDTADLFDTIDPLTVIYRAMQDLESSGTCQGLFRVWDGRRRFDLSISDMGAETLPQDRSWAWSGAARHCRVNLSRRGGFVPAETKASGEFSIWVAPLDTGWRVVKMAFDSRFGALVGRLVN